MHYELREGVEFKINRYYKDYLTCSYYNSNDLEHDLNFSIRMDVYITKFYPYLLSISSVRPRLDALSRMPEIQI